MFYPLAEVFDHVLVLHPFDINILLKDRESSFINSVNSSFLHVCQCHELTLGLIPSTPSGTLGKASYRVETYVITDFSSGD